MAGASITVALTLLLAAGPARAFTIGTSGTKACHELMSGRSIGALKVDKPDGWVREWPDQDESWIRLAHWLEDEGLIEYKDDDGWRLLQVSVFTGSRFPDQRGFGVTDLQGLREIHLSDTDQEEHSLRNPGQDGEVGDRLALEAARALIRQQIWSARDPFDPWSMEGHMTTVSIWIEFYGEVDISVWEPAFLVGRALHTMQDSFAHTYRSPDLQRVHAVCNYLEAISGDYDEARDGPRHSDYIDDCDRKEVEPIEDAAILAGTELFDAALVYMDTGDMAEVDRVLDSWMTLEPGCGYGADYCGTPWAELARRDETMPLGCSATSAPASPISLLVLALMALSFRGARACRTLQNEASGGATGQKPLGPVII